MSLAYFCLHKLVQTSGTNVNGSPCCTHGGMLVLGADAMKMVPDHCALRWFALYAVGPFAQPRDAD
jgi:hypothetical protein